MSSIKRVRRGILIYLVFMLACLRTMVARVLPGVETEKAERSGAEPPAAEPWSVRPATSLTSHPQYALQAIGVFPYVKLVPITARAVPVPIEVAGMAGGEGGHAAGGTDFLVHKTQASAASQNFVGQFLLGNCSCSCSCSCSCGDCSCSCSCC